jgi:hypothetical protein
MLNSFFGKENAGSHACRACTGNNNGVAFHWHVIVGDKDAEPIQKKAPKALCKGRF